VKAITLAVAAAALLTAACGSNEGNQSAAAPAAAQQVTGAGSTFVYPVLSAWAADYQKQSGTRINYQSIGSGAGISQVKAGTVEFGASDQPLSSDELAASGLAQFPIVIGGIVAVVNVPGLDSAQLRLTGPLLAGKRRPNAPKHRTDSRNQLARAERLGHIIVGAGLEPADAVAFLAARGQHDDRDMRCRRLAPKPPANLDAAHPFDHPVEDDEVGHALVGEDQSLVAVGGADDVIAFAIEVPHQEVREGAVVLHQQ
jgi:hypothetical protein